MMDVSYSPALEYSVSSYSFGRNDSSDAAQIIPLSVAYSFVFLTGVIGNSIVLFAIYKSRRLHTITCIFANMAIVDLIVCLLIVPIQIVQEFINHWPYGEAICKLISYLMLLNPTCSVFTLTLISFER
ncbi:putative neuropeptide FF receptor 2 [Apostichopus japonicus]|uniref:Putative neuropeptide FF receptor 2 n=1 Tax=Stichopus japonicus TaxID=307972 RepID=A0A2G8JMU0_STIJA|nr:putative neuropeptide FF receptor 2 [Apostichopus japonicus]